MKKTSMGSSQHAIRQFSRLVTYLTLALLTWSQLAAADIIFAGRPMGPSSNIYAVDAKAKLHKLTNDSRWRDVMAHIAQDGSVVFISDRSGDPADNPAIDLKKKSARLNMFIMNPKGGEITQLTDTDELEAFPQFSPDGRLIAFVERSKNGSALKVIARDGDGQRTLATAEDISALSWSPDGKRISYAMRDGDMSAVKIVDLPQDEQSATSQNLVEVNTTPAPTPDATSPDVNSADKPASADTIGAQRPRGFEQLITSAQWSPDGTKIAYIVSSLTQPERVLRVIDLRTGADKPISNVAVQVQQPVTWGADSEQLLYSGLVDYKFYYDEQKHKKVYEGAMHIFLGTVAGNNKQLSKGEHLHNRPTFSPDGKEIAYLYGDTLDDRTLAVRTMDLNGSTTNELYSGTTRDSFLYWTTPIGDLNVAKAARGKSQ